MPTFRQLLRAHAPLLVLDAASSRVQVGWLESEAEVRWTASVAEAGIGLFECLSRLQVQPGNAAGFVFCEGPGSILGVRTTAMAVRAWCVLQPRPVFAYQSLALVASACGEPELSVIADARRDTWHCSALGSPLRRVPTAELPNRLGTPEGFRTWSQPPAGVRQLGYAVDDLLKTTPDADIFLPREAPDAFLHEEPIYAAWSPKIHRAP